MKLLLWPAIAIASFLLGASAGAALGYSRWYRSSNRPHNVRMLVIEHHAAEMPKGGTITLPLERSCVYGASVPPTFAIWGDSHGVEPAAALGEIAARHGRSIAQFTFSSCAPVLGGPQQTADCRRFTTEVLRFLRQHPTIHTVLMFASLNDPRYLHDLSFAGRYRKMVESLLVVGKRVVLVDPIPSPPSAAPASLALLRATGRDVTSFGADKDSYLSHMSGMRDMIRTTGGNLVTRIAVADRLCPKRLCLTYLNGAVLYFDDNHLSLQGAQFLNPLFEPLFTDVAVAPLPQHAHQSPVVSFATNPAPPYPTGR